MRRYAGRSSGRRAVPMALRERTAWPTQEMTEVDSLQIRSDDTFFWGEAHGSIRACGASTHEVGSSAAEQHSASAPRPAVIFAFRASSSHT
eukprot:scaffold65863_cov66-Phaeocystis_antarctica.AAC.3